MRCQQIMRRPVKFVKSGATLAVAARTMRDAHVGFVPVCDATGRVRGVVTDRDLVIRAIADDRDPCRTLVDEIMTRDIVYCRPIDEIAVAEQKMREHRKSRVLVLADDKRAVGVISLSDLAARRDPEAVETLRQVAQREVVRDDGDRAAPR